MAVDEEALIASVDSLESEGLRELTRRAIAVREKAYAPYSNYRVGSAIRTVRGDIYAGCNVENGSLGISICAERSAVCAAVAAEGPEMRITAAAVHALDVTAASCGACRQVLAEFGPGAQIVFPRENRFSIMSIEELLPVAYRLNKLDPQP